MFDAGSQIGFVYVSAAVDVDSLRIVMQLLDGDLRKLCDDFQGIGRGTTNAVKRLKKM